jgi:hypothetical protein
VVDPLVLGPLLKALVGKLQVALVLLEEVPVAQDLVEGHLMGAALMVDQVIAVLEAIALTAEARVMTDHHPAMETVEAPVAATAVGMAAATAVGTVAVMVVVMVVVMEAATAVGTVAATAVVETMVMMEMETTRV